MSYAPALRGPHPVGVRTVVLRDPARGDGGGDGAGGADGQPRELPVELWYPAEAATSPRDIDPGDEYKVLPVMPMSRQAAVRDAAPAPTGGERRPLLLFSHGLGGHRRQSTFVCTHLASHGYLVAGIDHTGNTLADAIAAFMGWGPRTSLFEALPRWIADRPADASFVLDALCGGAVAELAAQIDPSRVGMFGHSFGGWTTLVTASRDPRVRAALALAPAGGQKLVEGDELPAALEMSWTRELPLLLVAAARDSILPLAGIRGIHERAPAPKRLVVLAETDHMHFCDDARRAHEMFRNLPVATMMLAEARGIRPFDELCAEAPAHAAIRALAVAHFDAFLRGAAEARAWLRRSDEALLELGVATLE